MKHAIEYTLSDNEVNELKKEGKIPLDATNVKRDYKNRLKFDKLGLTVISAEWNRLQSESNM